MEDSFNVTLKGDLDSSVYHLQDMMLGVWRGQIIKAAVDADVFTQL